MRGCTCHGLVLCPHCRALAERAGVLAPPEAPFVTEKGFMQAVIREAKRHGWICYHTHDSRRSLPGYPDLTLVRNGICLFVECKVPGGVLTLQQHHWLRALEAVEKTAAYVWYPTDWDMIRSLLGSQESLAQPNQPKRNQAEPSEAQPNGANLSTTERSVTQRSQSSPRRTRP